jgi:Peptidase family M1 domain
MSPRLPRGGSLCALAVLLSLFVVPINSRPQSTAAPDSTYSALRNLGLGNEAVTISNYDLKRDAGTFRLRSGTVCFLAPVNNKVTGAIFAGDGLFLLSPPDEAERKSLQYLTKQPEFNEHFERALFRFTDATYDELKKAGTPVAGGCDVGILKDSQSATRHRIKHNLEIDILAEVLSPNPRPLFIAFIHGKNYNDKEIFELNPNRDSNQVDFSTYDENKYGDWASFNFTGPHPPGSVGRNLRMDHHTLDTSFEKSGALSGKAITTFVSLRNGLRVVPLMLFPTLRVQSVTADGQPLYFIQENKNDDADFAVVLPKPLAAGEKCTITTVYAGKDAVTNEGGDNYFPIARQDWYPNSISGAFGEYATYDLTFRIPKGMKLAATGALVSDTNEGNQNVTVWKSESPQTVAGFSFGRFQVEEAKLTKPPVLVLSFANEELPASVTQLLHVVNGDLPGQQAIPGVTLGSMSTTGLNKKALAESELAVQLYTDYFGPSQFSQIRITQQTACNFGQSWPGLVWIPICYYFDNTVRHQLGLDWGDRGYWRVVTPHEVAHQWWGHTVGFSSGRDQWMSEGFADMSASLYISFIEKDQKKFITFWNDERELLLERDAQGFRAIDVGPVTMGYRASNARTGYEVTRRLIYPKGAYILHMLRLMMWDNHTGDQAFKAMMQDFVNTYRGKPATTEDFKAMVEKHMTSQMDMEHNHKMDWFFNEYVYGTQLPAYKFDYNFTPDPNGDIVFSFTLSQSNVDKNFHMPVPIYLELDNGKIYMLGRAHADGTTTIQDKVPLKGMKTPPRHAMINYYDDVLELK